MKLLLVYQPTDGGVARHVLDIASEFAGRPGWDVHTCGPARIPGMPAVVGHSELRMQRAVRPLQDARAVAALRRVVQDTRPDLIHSHSSKAGAIARLAFPRGSATPVLYTPHGFSFDGYFRRSATRRLYLAFERLLALRGDFIICVCRYEMDLARQITSADRIRLAYNGIDPVPLRGGARSEHAAGGGPRLCTLTLLRPGKGLETLIDALPAVREHFPSVKLRIGGTGPCLASLQARALSRGVDSEVSFAGPVAEINPFLQDADIFVFPSWAESFPYAILEAMAAELPIVASAVGGIPEAITDGESGVLVAPRDARALGGAVIDLLGDATRRGRLGSAAGVALRSGFTRGAMHDALSTIYTEAAQRAPRAH
ncbi:MAG: glycosyltransferase family 4 protein [Solirubrobacteraceae bacterium]